jgi:hypothetical protein
MEGIMHALKEQQRQSFEQHAQVLAVLQEQGRQLQGLLIDREMRDNATNREHDTLSSQVSPSDIGRLYKYEKYKSTVENNMKQAKKSNQPAKKSNHSHLHPSGSTVEDQRKLAGVDLVAALNHARVERGSRSGSGERHIVERPEQTSVQSQPSHQLLIFHSVETTFSIRIGVVFYLEQLMHRIAHIAQRNTIAAAPPVTPPHCHTCNTRCRDAMMMSFILSFSRTSWSSGELLCAL